MAFDIIGAINIATKDAVTNQLYNNLVAAGFPTGVLATTYAMAQCMAWSDYMQSPVAKQNNNYAGILWIPYQDSSKGSTAGKHTYARFADLQGFGRYYKKVLGSALQSSTAQEYINSLAKNKFFAPVNATAFNAALRSISDTLNRQRKTVIKYNQEVQNTSQLLQGVYADANRILQAVTSVGIPDPARSYAVYQAYHESAAFKDYKYRDYNNPTGIKYAGQANARPGSNNYAIFNSLRDWAVSLKYELSKGQQPPIKAMNLEDYASRLKANGYYEDSYSNYFSGLQRARLVLKVLPAEQRADGTKDMDIPGSHAPAPGSDSDWLKDLEAWAKNNPLKAGIALILVVAGTKKVLE